MSEEELNRKMEFVVEQQARLVVNQQKAEERMSGLESLVGRLAAATTAGFKELNEKVSALGDAQIRTEESVSTLADKVTELAEAQAHTDRRLDALIDIIREGRNGKPQG